MVSDEDTALALDFRSTDTLMESQDTPKAFCWWSNSTP